MILQQPFEKALGRLAVASCLQKHIDHLSVLINGWPQVLLLTLGRSYPTNFHRVPPVRRPLEAVIPSDGFFADAEVATDSSGLDQPTDLR